MDFEYRAWIDVHQSIWYLWRDCDCIFRRFYLGGDDQTNSSFNLWYAIGFSLMGLSTALLAHTYIALCLILIIFSLQLFLYFESTQSEYYKNNNKYADARNLITNLVTICCITLLAFIFNPYT